MKGILNYIRISVCKCGVNNSMFDIDGIFSYSIMIVFEWAV